MARVTLAFRPGFGPVLVRPGSLAGPGFPRFFIPWPTLAMALVTLAFRLGFDPSFQQSRQAPDTRVPDQLNIGFLKTFNDGQKRPQPI